MKYILSFIFIFLKINILSSQALKFEKIILVENDESMTILDSSMYELKNKSKNGESIQFIVTPRENFVIEAAYLTFKFDSTFRNKYSQITSNGFQSWSESKIMTWNERPVQLSSIMKPYSQYYGDEHYLNTIEKKQIHSWNYIEFFNPFSYQSILLGSFQEFISFSCFIVDSKKNELIVKTDWKGYEFKKGSPESVVNFGYFDETKNSNYAQWAYYYPLKTDLETKQISGWTSWYNYYTKINEKIILSQLDYYHKSQIDYFQIDDGYQEQVGDWVPNNKFRNDLKYISDQINMKNIKAGIWIAPFVANSKSKIFKNNPDWFLKDKNGNFLKAGNIPAWGGWYFALDIYNNEVQTYLKKVFEKYIQKDNFSLIKADFLFAACILPRKNKTRAMVMYDAMKFLNECIGEAKLLACGIPIGSAMGNTDFCRIGNDMHLNWEYDILKLLGARERPSCKSSIENTIVRYPLTNRFFRNDPDVYYLRKNNLNLTRTQKECIYVVNHLLGEILFTSDDLFMPKENFNIDFSRYIISKNIFKIDSHTYYIGDYMHNETTSYKVMVNVSKGYLTYQ